MKHHPVAATLLAVGLLSGTALAQTSTMPQPQAGAAMPMKAADAMSEAKALLERQGEGTGRKAYSPETGVKFKASDNVFLKSALAVDFTYRKATVTLPLYKGLSPKGEPVYYIITEASDFEVAKQMGINFAPKMKHAAGSPGAQKVTVADGVITFKGNVDFAPKYAVEPGSPMPFPTKVAVNGRDRPVFHHAGQSPALVVVELGEMAGRLAVDQPSRPIPVESQNSIPNGLKTDAAEPYRVRPRASVVDLRQGQKPTSLRRVLRGLGRSPQSDSVEIGSQRNGDAHGRPPCPSHRFRTQPICIPSRVPLSAAW